MRAFRAVSPTGRRRLLLLAVVGALALATAAALAAATPRGTTVIKTPLYPIFAVSGYGSIWVGAHHGVVVYRINPATNRIVKQIIIGHTPCGQAAVGFGAIFVPDCIDEGGDTLEISAKTNKVVRKFPGGAALGYGSVWTVNADGTLLRRLDPQSGVTLAKVPTGFPGGGSGNGCVGVAGAGGMWLGSDVNKTVTRIDAATNKIVALIPLPGAATQPSPAQGYASGCEMALAGGKVWYGNPAGIYEIDPATNTATLLRIKIGNLDKWGDIVFATGLGSVWVRTSGTSVTRIDPATGNVIRSYPATGGGGGLTVSYGSLWVTNAGADSTWREPVH
jgi:virginiamycin B lyase